MMLSQSFSGCKRAAHSSSSSSSSSRRRVAGMAPRAKPAIGLTRSRCTCKASAAPQQLQPQLALHIGDTTIQMPFSAAQAQQLDAALATLLQTFADKQEAKRPRRWDMMEVRFAGPEAVEGLDVLEVFCNPNAHATAFDAKLLVTIKAAGGLNVMCEGRLSAIKADLDAYLAAVQG